MITNEVEIVIVEDNPNDVELLMRVFKKHNLANDIVVLRDGVEALDFLLGQSEKSFEVDKSRLIVLDLKLPRVDGIEVLRRLKSDERTRATPVIVLTSSQEDRDLRDSTEAGVDSYVTKPIDFKDFAKIVSEINFHWLIVSRNPQEI